MANSRNTAKVILRAQTLTAVGTATLALQLFVSGRRKIISLGIYVKPDEFDSINQKVKIKGDVEATRRHNALIFKKLNRVNEIFFNADFNDETLTMQRFMQLFDSKVSRDSFSAFTIEQIKLHEGSVSKNTIGQYELMLKYAHEFAKTENISFAMVDHTFIEGYERHLKKHGLGINTRAKFHTKIKKFINLAVAKGKILHTPYQNFKVKKAKTMRDWLTPTELEMLFNIYNARTLRSEWQRVLRYFLFSCVCGGLRISELKILETANKVGDNLVVDTVKGSNYERRVAVPFSEVGLALWKDRDNTKTKIFDCISDQNSNDTMKIVARAAGIEKNVTMHVARHTFATNYILFGGRIEMLQDILGHSKLETTQIYLHLAEAYTQKGEQMKNFDRFFRVEKKKIIPIAHKIAS